MIFPAIRHIGRAALLILGISFASTSLAMPIMLEATIDGAQASAGAGSGSAGIGTAAMQFDEGTSIFSWDIEWSGLSSAAFLAHFHGPANPDQNGAVQVDIGGISGVASPSIGETTITAGQAADLLAGRWYINIHTPQFPGGEIRGQVVRSASAVPVPSSLALILLAVLGLRASRARTA